MEQRRFADDRKNTVRTTWLRCLVLGLLVTAGLLAGPATARAEDDYSFIGIKHASQVTKFITRLQKAIAANDKNAVAGLVSYPIIITLGGKDFEVKSKAAFVQQYDRIMTAARKQDILAQRLDDIFANKQGVMIGSSGQVWALPEGNALRISVIRE